MLWDTHMHTSYSGDSEAAPIDMINKAKSIGLGGITITDHLDYDYFESPDMFNLDVDDYFRGISALSEKESTKDFKILKGIEIGLQPSVAKKNAAIASGFDFDFIIGSTHVVDAMDPYYEKFWKNHTGNSGYKRYYEAILENIKAFDDFDSIGHLDYIFRYHRVSDKVDTYSDYAEIVDEILKHIIKKDIALEINTGAFRKGLLEPNPSSTIIKRYKELGGKMLTLGADAHSPEYVALEFSKMPEFINSCGFNSLFRFEKRKPVEYKI